jgi:hypothetical protein
MAPEQCGPAARSVKPIVLDTSRARSDVAAAMAPTPDWVAPTVALSLAVIAACLVAMGGVVVAIGLGLRHKSRALAARLATISSDARTLSARLRHEVESYADLSVEARGKLKGAMSAVEARLEDLDALAEVLQDEVEEAALGAAALVRTVRRSGTMLGAARRALRRGRRRRAPREE